MCLKKTHQKPKRSAEKSCQLLEEGRRLTLDFNKIASVAAGGRPVVPVVVQDVETREVLLLAYADRRALQYTLRYRRAAFWSTSRGELWIKGATSGDTLAVVEVRVNCEQNSLLYLVRPEGEGVCHTRGADGKARRTCYYRRIRDGRLEFVL